MIVQVARTLGLGVGGRLRLRLRLTQTFCARASTSAPNPNPNPNPNPHQVARTGELLLADTEGQTFRGSHHSERSDQPYPYPHP